MLRNKLSEIITVSPDVIQFAKDRKYEEAWIISKSENRPSELDINNYLNKESFEILIVEYIWNSNDNENRFVLTLFLDKNCILKDPKKFVDINMDLFYKYPGFEEFISNLDKKVVGHEYLFTNKIDLINIGIFNYWLSTGPVELWKGGEVFDMKEVQKKIEQRPEINITSMNYQGLLFRFNVAGNGYGPTYGIKTPCCKSDGSVWKVDFNKINFWMKTFFESLYPVGK